MKHSGLVFSCDGLSCRKEIYFKTTDLLDASLGAQSEGWIVKKSENKEYIHFCGK